MAGKDDWEAQEVWTDSLDEAQANARLIAAAPDMLTALVDMVAAARHLGLDDHPIFDRAEMVIHKARGAMTAEDKKP